MKMQRFLCSVYKLSSFMIIFIVFVIIILHNKNGQKTKYKKILDFPNDVALVGPTKNVLATTMILKTVDEFLSTFIDKLVNIRTVHLKSLGQMSWTPTSNTTDLIDADSPKFLPLIRDLTELQTITITINLKDLSKRLPWVGFEYGGNNCELMEAKSEYGNNVNTYNAGYGKRYYKASCQGNISSLIKPISFQKNILDIGYYPAFKPKDEEKEETVALTYLHVVQNTIVQEDGDVFFGHYKYCPQRCYANKKLDGKPGGDLTLHKEVFTIAQFWGMGYFHFMNEELPRLIAWLPFLKHYPDIKIHVNSRPGFVSTTFQGLGLNPGRIVTGHVRALLLYLPAGTPCGAQTYFNSKLLSLHLQEHIINKVEMSSHLQTNKNSSKHTNGSEIPHQTAAPALAGSLKSPARNYIVLIKRSIKRYFNNHDDILKELIDLGKNYGLQVMLFEDTNLPKYEEMAKMFHNAVAIVGPHGAGLSNMFYSQPGTVVIEGLCYNDGVGNLCYRNLAKNIGLRYYGILLKENCFNVKPSHIIPPLTKFLDLIYENNAKS